MKEPTREQIKEAFKKTIERWEKIVGDTKYFGRSSCSLCQIPPTGCHPECPIGLYVGKKKCIGTPYVKFDDEPTPANALAELNFLREVYIWWMEGDDKDKSTGVVRKEEKKKGRKVGACRAFGCKFLEFDGDCSSTEYCAHKSPEEKKEEWVDITGELSTEILACGDGYTVYFYHDNKKIGFADNDGVFLDAIVFKRYGLREDDTNFTFLKKQ